MTRGTPTDGGSPAKPRSRHRGGRSQGRDRRTHRQAENNMLTIIVIIASFIGVAALVGGVAVMFRGDANNVVEDRLDILAGMKSPTSGRGASEPESSLLSSPLDETRGMIERMLSRLGNFRRLLEQADAPLDPSKFVLLTAGLASAGAAVCILVPGVPKILAPVVRPVLGVRPLLWILLRRRARLRKFGRRCPKRWN